MRAFRHTCKKLYFLLEIYWLENRNKYQKCIDVDFCVDAAIAVDFDIDEILEVPELLFADDVDVNAAKRKRSFITQYDFESRDIERTKQKI